MSIQHLWAARHVSQNQKDSQLFRLSCWSTSIDLIVTYLGHVKPSQTPTGCAGGIHRLPLYTLAPTFHPGTCIKSFEFGPIWSRSSFCWKTRHAYISTLLDCRQSSRLGCFSVNNVISECPSIGSMRCNLLFFSLVELWDMPGTHSKPSYTQWALWDTLTKAGAWTWKDREPRQRPLTSLMIFASCSWAIASRTMNLH